MGIFGIGRLCRRPDLLRGEMRPNSRSRIAVDLLRKILGPVDAHIVIDELRVLQAAPAVAGQHLRIIGHHRAVVVVLAQTLVDVIGHAGVENGVHAQLGQKFNVAVGQLRREAGGVAGDGALPLQIQLPAGHGAVVPPAKPSFVKNVCQKGYSSQKFRHRGKPISPPPVLARLVAQKQLPLIFIQIPALRRPSCR